MCLHSLAQSLSLPLSRDLTFGQSFPEFSGGAGKMSALSLLYGHHFVYVYIYIGVYNTRSDYSYVCAACGSVYRVIYISIDLCR